MPVATGAGRQRVRPVRRLVRGSFVTRRLRDTDSAMLTILVVAAIPCAWLLYEYGSVTISIMTIPLVIGSVVLGPRHLPWYVIYVLILTVGAVGLAALEREDLSGGRIVGLAVAFVIGLIILLVSLRRSSLGVAGIMGESMLVDLRDRISKQAEIPHLPSAWYAEGVLRSAGGASFAGDFFVAAKTPDDRHLQVAVVDVSGKGVQAGTRSLLLSGAFGGLLGALPAEKFLPAANDYLLAQDWSEGFATAVHLSLDLQSGAFEVRSAGHPPAVQLNAGSGRWVVHEAVGPVLGLIPDGEFPPVAGRLLPGDALLLYTDGLVETPSRDIALGIDKLVGQAERLLRSGFENGAKRLIERVDSFNDDRALLLIHRR